MRSTLERLRGATIVRRKPASTHAGLLDCIVAMRAGSRRIRPSVVPEQEEEGVVVIERFVVDSPAVCWRISTHCVPWSTLVNEEAATQVRAGLYSLVSTRRRSASVPCASPVGMRAAGVPGTVVSLLQ